MYIDCSGNYKDTLNIHIFYTLIFSMQFSQNKELLEALLATKGTTLVEASPETQYGVLGWELRTRRHWTRSNGGGLTGWVRLSLKSGRSSSRQRDSSYSDD